jgi:hypothetical protein
VVFAKYFRFEPRHARFGTASFIQMCGRLLPSKTRLPGLERLARIADKFHGLAFHKVDQLDFRVVMVNETETAGRSHA